MTDSSLEPESFCLEAAQEVSQRLAGLVGEGLAREVQADYPVQAEVAEVVTQLTPGRDAPGHAPEREAQGTHAALALGIGGVPIGHRHLALLLNALAQEGEPVALAVGDA